MSREEFERGIPGFLSVGKLFINSIPPSSRTHIGLDRPPGETVIYTENMTDENIKEFVDWGKVRVAGIHRVSQIFRTDVYSEADLCGSDYAYCEFLSGGARIANEAFAFRAQRCDSCGRTEYTQADDLAIRRGMGRRPFFLTPSCDFIVDGKLGKFFSECNVNVRPIKGSLELYQVFPLTRFRFSRAVKHQHCSNFCDSCGEFLGVVFNSAVGEGIWRVTATSDLKFTHSNKPIVAIVPGGSIGRDQMFQAPQSSFGNLGIPAEGTMVRPYGRHEMKTTYILSGKLLRCLRDEIGWRSLRQCVERPAILEVGQ